MRRPDLPPVPQLSLTRKKSQQVPTTDKGEKHLLSQPYAYTPQQFPSSSRLTINQISRVSSQSQSRVSTSSINRDAYMIEPSSNPPKLSNSRSQSRISYGATQQSFQYSILSSAHNHQPQSYYVPPLLASLARDRTERELEIEAQTLLKNIDIKSLMFKQKMKKLTDSFYRLEDELSMINDEESNLERSMVQLDCLKNESMELGQSCVFMMEKVLKSC